MPAQRYWSSAARRLWRVRCNDGLGVTAWENGVHPFGAAARTKGRLVMRGETAVDRAPMQARASADANARAAEGWGRRSAALRAFGCLP